MHMHKKITHKYKQLHPPREGIACGFAFNAGQMELCYFENGKEWVFHV